MANEEEGGLEMGGRRHDEGPLDRFVSDGKLPLCEGNDGFFRLLISGMPV